MAFLSYFFWFGKKRAKKPAKFYPINGVSFENGKKWF